MPLDKYTTERLSVHSWRPALENMAARQTLEVALSAFLTRRVLEHLPPPFQLNHQDGGISSWIDMRAKESEVLLVDWKGGKGLVGLMILAPDPGADERPTIHIGYLLAEAAWGQGIASELVNGLVSALKNDEPVRLVGGVDRCNPASARVLQKAGFVLQPYPSSSGADMYVHDFD